MGLKSHQLKGTPVLLQIFFKSGTTINVEVDQYEPKYATDGSLKEIAWKNSPPVTRPDLSYVRVDEVAAITVIKGSTYTMQNHRGRS